MFDTLGSPFTPLLGDPTGSLRFTRDETPISAAPHALVVDDDVLVRLDAMDILEQAGFQALNAEHGDAAFDLLRTRHPDVVLLFTDVQMPGELDGFASARSVAASWPHISIVVASGHVKLDPGLMPDKARFVAKPFSAALVYAHLQEILPHGQKPEPLKSAMAASTKV